MKAKRTFTLSIVYMILLYLCNADESNYDSISSENPIKITDDDEEDYPLIEYDETKDTSNEIQHHGELVEDDPQSRQLKRKKKNKTTKDKTLRRKKASKKAKKRKGKKGKKRKNKKKNKKTKKNEKQTSETIDKPQDEVSDIEKKLPKVPDEDTNDDLIPETLELPPEVVDDASSDSSRLDKVENQMDKTKLYWDSDILEPEHVINEWFAIFDGKKISPESTENFPNLSEDQSDYDNEYLLEKKKNSKSLTEAYSSVSKFKGDDDENANYVRPVIISNDLLRMTHPDTKEDDLENMILSRKFKRQYNGNMYQQQTKPPKRRNKTGSYDLKQDLEYGSEINGIYRKVNNDEIENDISNISPSDDDSQDDENDNTDITDDTENLSEETASENEKSDWQFGEMDISDDSTDDEDANKLSKKECRKKIKMVESRYKKIIGDLKRKAHE